MKHKITTIYHDLDGVHADFEKGVKDITGGFPHQIEKKHMWKAINRKGDFFETLKPLADSRTLFEYTSTLGVDQKVLTGMPTIKDGAGQKERWAQKHLLEDIHVIVLPSKQKYLHAGPGKILIDDRPDMIGAWCDAGGIGILHTSAESTIAQLKALGL
jgi:hypothetical protein